MVGGPNSIWEEDFKGFSYGFRPRRSQQGSPLVSGGIGCALRRDNKQEGELGAGLGIKSFFDKIEHEWLVKFVEHRIADKRIVRLIQKWLDQLAQMHGPLVRGYASAAMPLAKRSGSESLALGRFPARPTPTHTFIPTRYCQPF